MRRRSQAAVPARAGWRAAVFVSLLSLAAPAAAQDTPDTQAWAQILALGTIGEAWRTHVEVQPRFMNDASELGLTIVRYAVGRKVAPRVTAFVGHAWVPRTLGSGVRHEQRTWQQLSFTAPALAGWAPTARVRLEQRWLSPWDGASHRLRTLGRLQRPLSPTGRLSVYGYDELMLTLDRTPRGPTRGFDRNRLSAGVSRRLSPVAAVDLGYLWETATIPGGRRNDHVLVGVLTLSVPR